MAELENLKAVLPNPPLSQEEPSTSVAETLDSTSIPSQTISNDLVADPSETEDNAVVGVHDSPAKNEEEEEEEEIDFAKKRAGNDGVAGEDIDAGEKSSKDLDSEGQGIRDTDESENKVENAVDGNAKASSLEGVAAIGAIESCNGEGKKEVQGNRGDKLDKDEDNRELDEADLVKPPPHWLPKACILLVAVGGCISEEFYVPCAGSRSWQR